MSAAELSRAAFTAEQFLNHLTFELRTETSLIPHGFKQKGVQPEGKVLSFHDYTPDPAQPS
jgi:hypothetical protein